MLFKTTAERVEDTKKKIEKKALRVISHNIMTYVKKAIIFFTYKSVP